MMHKDKISKENNSGIYRYLSAFEKKAQTHPSFAHGITIFPRIHKIFPIRKEGKQARWRNNIKSKKKKIQKT